MAPMVKMSLLWLYAR